MSGPRGVGRVGKLQRIPVSEFVRVALLALLTLVVFGASWALGSVAAPRLAATAAAPRTVVVTAAVPGLADNTYRIHVVDAAEAGRTLVASAVVVTPVAEVRRVGTKPAPAPSDIETVIRSAAAAWGADPDQLLRVAWCESRYNPYAVNARSGAAGLFQFMPATWAANSVRAGYGGASVFDAVANAK